MKYQWAPYINHQDYIPGKLYTFSTGTKEFNFNLDDQVRRYKIDILRPTKTLPSNRYYDLDLLQFSETQKQLFEQYNVPFVFKRRHHPSNTPRFAMKCYLEFLVLNKMCFIDNEVLQNGAGNIRLVEFPI